MSTILNFAHQIVFVDEEGIDEVDKSWMFVGSHHLDLSEQL